MSTAQAWLDQQTVWLWILFAYGDHETELKAIEAFLEVLRLQMERAA